MRVLLADDEASLRITLTDDLVDAGHEVTAVAEGDAALAALAEGPFDCVVTDLKMPGADGMAVLAAARERETAVVIITGAGSVESAVAAMKQGAYDYVEKPFLNEEVVLLLERLGETLSLQREVKELRVALQGREGLRRVLTRSAAMETLLGQARAAARTDAGVLIIGESGTGKEVLARALHEESPRSAGTFVPIACGVLAESLLEDELFGHVRGAFTGAAADRAGRFEQATGGTVFLDDIDDMPLPTQVKLLRVLQERCVERLGSTASIPVDIRVVAASKVPLETLVQKGSFREDLYYRLNVVALQLPPLRQRSEDIPLLVTHFIALHAAGEGRAVSPQTLAAMQEYPWPGNVRELENAVLRALALTPAGEALLAPEYLLPGSPVPGGDSRARTLAAAVAEAERRAIRLALAQHEGNRTRAAATLGISRKHLWEKIKRLEMDV